jgi:hypothetical protein
MSTAPINLIPVFRLKPNRQHVEDAYATAEIKFIDNITETQKLGDEAIELNVPEKVKELYGSNGDYIGNIDSYDITVKGYRNNMTGNYMIKSKYMPVCSINFMYTKSIVVGYLFNIHIYFVLDGLKNHFLIDPKSYVGAKIYGRYVLALESEGELKYAELEKRIEKYATGDVAAEITQKNLNLSEDEILTMIKTDIEEKKTFYKKLLEGIILTSFKNIRHIFDTELIPIYKNKHIKSLIKFGIEMRQLKRQKEYGLNLDDYKIPTKVLKLSDYKDNPNLIDKYLGIESSDDE